MMFGQRVDIEGPVIISKVNLNACISGIRRRILKEQKRITSDVGTDENYEAKRRDNVRRLRIIKDELTKLYEEL